MTLRRAPRLASLLALVFALGACADDAPNGGDAQPTPDAPLDGDVAPADAPPPDATPADVGPMSDAPADGGSSDAAPADVPAPDDASLDVASPDVASPDVALPDVAPPADVLADVVAPPDVSTADVDDCPLAACGVTCFDALRCGMCGNSVCDPAETTASCPADCCETARCDPAAGLPYAAGDARCSGTPDGARCDDGDLANGIETCRAGRCLHEHAHCRCVVPGGSFPRAIPEPRTFALPTLPADPPWRGTPPADPAFARQWSLARIDLSRAWQRTRGASTVRVAVVDTGCDTSSPDLMGQVEAQRDLIDGDDTAQDDHGHGTAMAALIAARSDAAGVVGVAPGVRLLCARVADTLGVATLDRLAAGIQWAVAQRASVIFVGVGSVRGSPALDAAVAAARVADAVIVAPSGSNGGATLDRYPAAYDGVVSVAASDRYDRPTRDTDLSPTTALLAPGEEVATIVRDGTVTQQDGASPAAAIVAGVAALVRSAEPSLSESAVRALLRATGASVADAAFQRAFVARRVDAGAAVEAARAGRVDLAALRVSFVSASGLPREPTRARVSFENRGTVAVRGASATFSVAEGSARVGSGTPSGRYTQALPTMAPGEVVEVTVELTPSPSQTRLQLDARVTAAGDALADNDLGSAALPLRGDVLHRLWIERASITPTPTGYALAATVENAGNVPEPASESHGGFAGPIANVGLTRAAHGVLQPGERAELRVTLPAPELPGHKLALVFERPARGQRDTSASVAALRVEHEASAGVARIAYFQLRGDNIIFDAPWRSIREQIPVMVFYARTNWVEEGWVWDTGTNVWMDGLRVRNPAGPASGVGPLVYEDRPSLTDATTPADPSLLARLVVTDEDGSVTARPRLADRYAPIDGRHRLLWLPASALNTSASGLPDPAARGTFLEMEATYYYAHLTARFPSRTRKMLGVARGTALPTLGAGDRFFDAHFHSIAEWYTGNRSTGPAKAYGGPLEMLLATAWSVGTIEGSVPLRWTADTVVTTDHNTYFEDGEAPGAGPTRVSQWPGATGTTGSPEMNLYRGRLGRTAGEEVSLAGDSGGRAAVIFRNSGKGRHALLYDADRHVRGAWHAIDGCTPEPDVFLAGLSGQSATACGQDLSTVGGFTYAAHPFADGFLWDDDMLRDSLSLHGCGRIFSDCATHRFTRAQSATDPDGRFPLRGYQFWNGRAAQTVSSDTSTSTLRDINPFPGATHDAAGYRWRAWSSTCADYQGMVSTGLASYLAHVRDGLSLTFEDDTAPRRRFHRKLFQVAGSDAHGDFNYTLDLCATDWQDACTTFGMNSVSDSAWARPRTYVLGGSLASLRDGHTVSTDGPVIEAEIDGEGRGTWDAATGAGAWRNDVSDAAGWSASQIEERFDADGTIGGGGRLDGERTALVPYTTADPATQEILVRTRCRNTADFGGETPAALELLLTGNGGTSEAPTTIALTPHGCGDNAWHVHRVRFSAGQREPRAAMLHARFGSGCPGTYDAYANPIWLSPVRSFLPFRLRENATAGTFALEMDVATIPGTLYFHASMMREAVTARVYQVQADGSMTALAGGVDGRGGLQLTPSTTMGWSDSSETPPEFANTRLQVRIPAASGGMGPITGRRRAGVTAANEQLVLVVERGDGTAPDRRLRDAFGNPTGVLMMRFAPYSTCAQRTCTGDTRWCNSQCQCVVARQCTGGISIDGCACCLSYSCFPLPCFCAVCSAGTDVFARNCPGG